MRSGRPPAVRTAPTSAASRAKRRVTQRSVALRKRVGHHRRDRREHADGPEQRRAGLLHRGEQQQAEAAVGAEPLAEHRTDDRCRHGQLQPEHELGQRVREAHDPEPAPTARAEARCKRSSWWRVEATKPADAATKLGKKTASPAITAGAPVQDTTIIQQRSERHPRHGVDRHGGSGDGTSDAAPWPRSRRGRRRARTRRTGPTPPARTSPSPPLDQLGAAGNAELVEHVGEQDPHPPERAGPPGPLPGGDEQDGADGGHGAGATRSTSGAACGGEADGVRAAAEGVAATVLIGVSSGSGSPCGMTRSEDRCGRCGAGFRLLRRREPPPHARAAVRVSRPDRIRRPAAPARTRHRGRLSVPFTSTACTPVASAYSRPAPAGRSKRVWIGAQPTIASSNSTTSAPPPRPAARDRRARRDRRAPNSSSATASSSETTPWLRTASSSSTVVYWNEASRSRWAPASRPRRRPVGRARPSPWPPSRRVSATVGAERRAQVVGDHDVERTSTRGHAALRRDVDDPAAARMGGVGVEHLEELLGVPVGDVAQRVVTGRRARQQRARSASRSRKRRRFSSWASHRYRCHPGIASSMKPVRNDRRDANASSAW